MSAPILQRYHDNLLIGATITSTPAPLTSYSDATMLDHRPSERVRWNAVTVDIRLALATSGRADVLVIPVSNIDAGSSHLVLESDTGMSVAIPVPAMMPSGIPRTLAVDLTLLEPNATKRTSNGFNLVVSYNSDDLVMGGALMLYGPKREITTMDWSRGVTRRRQGLVAETPNDYGSDYVQNFEARTRAIDLATVASDAELAEIEAWVDANFGRGLPALIWPQPATGEAIFGRIREPFSVTQQFADYNDVKLTVDELGKGKPVV
jgi:hypothetical protein